MHDSTPSRGVWGHAPPKYFGISDTQGVLLVHFLTSKSTSVYAYSSQCMTMLKDRLPVWQINTFEFAQKLQIFVST